MACLGRHRRYLSRKATTRNGFLAAAIAASCSSGNGGGRGSFHGAGMLPLASALSASFSSSTTKASVSVLGTARDGVLNPRYLGGREGVGPVVSEACLGTMTWGVQNTQEDADHQLDLAIGEYGVNFIDTAELYPVPLTAPEWEPGRTETILGNYLAANPPSRRNQIILATKVCGYLPNSMGRTIVEKRASSDANGGGESGAEFPRLDRASVRSALDASLRRLQTDRVDLMQIHWPDRYVPLFGNVEYKHAQAKAREETKDEGADSVVSIEETASALRDEIEAGRIRYIGVSNESTYGLCEWVRATERLGIRDRLVSIQNSYSLLDRRFDSELAEACDQYGIGLLPWSVLAGGLLSGKYSSSLSSSLTKASSASRFIRYPEYMNRWSPTTASESTLWAVDQYTRIAQEVGMTPSQLAIAFVRSRGTIVGSGSVIVGATNTDQLHENLAPFVNQEDDRFVLTTDVLKALDDVHMKCPNPSCSL